MSVKFRIGDKAVYPSHGIGVIKRIETKEIAGAKQDFYVLQIVASGITLMIPTQAPERTGIRQLISDKQVNDVYSILKSPGKVVRTPWNRRFREFNDKLRTGSIREVAEVLRDLKTLQGGKNLSFGERQMFDKAKTLIVSEISEVSAKNSLEIEHEVDQILLPN